MPTDIDKDLETLRCAIAAAINGHWKLFLAQGLVMMALGMIAAALPQVSTLAVEIFIGWLFLVGGIFRALAVSRMRNAPGYGWSLASAVLAILIGLILVMRPYGGVVTLTVVLGVFFMIEGVAAFLISLEYRQYLSAWRWILFSGLVNLVLAFLIWRGWPASAGWAIGLFAGISLFFLGLSLTATAIAARAAAPHDQPD